MDSEAVTIAIQANDDGMFDPGEVFALSVNNVWYGNSNRASGTKLRIGTFDAGGTIRVIDHRRASGNTHACR